MSNQEEKDSIMISKTFAAIAAARIICTSTLALAQMTPAKIADTSKGKALVDGKGMTLYTFDKDAAGKSMCNGPCADNWPQLMASADGKASGEWTDAAEKASGNGPCADTWPRQMASADAKVSGDWTVVARDDGKMMWAHKGKP